MGITKTILENLSFSIFNFIILLRHAVERKRGHRIHQRPLTQIARNGCRALAAGDKVCRNIGVIGAYVGNGHTLPNQIGHHLQAR